MRRGILATALLSLLAGPGWAQAPAAAVPREAVVANDTDRSFQELYIYRPGAAREGPDRLGTDVLPPRATLRVPLGRTRDCSFEVRAVFEAGEAMRRRLDVCRNPRVAFADTGPRREVEVVNQTDQLLRELYLAPPGAGDPGPDRLGSQTVAAGAVLRLRLRNTPGCVVDLRAVFADETEERRARHDLCRNPRLGFGDPEVPVREAVLTNAGGRTLRELYVRAAGAGAWGADRLGTEVVEPRGRFTLRLRSPGCAFEVRAVFADDREEVQRDRDLCASPALRVGAAAAAGGEAHRLTLVNGFGRAVQQVFLSPAGSTAWGEDALGEALIAPGAQHGVVLQGGCRADLRIVFDTRAAEERRDIDICALRTLTLRPGWTLAELAPAGPARPAAGGLRLRNIGTEPLVALYADAPGAPQPGVNRLDGRMLGAGESLELALPEGQCRVDLTAVFANGREVLLPDTEACAGPPVELR